MNVYLREKGKQNTFDPCLYRLDLNTKKYDKENNRSLSHTLPPKDKNWLEIKKTEREWMSVPYPLKTPRTKLRTKKEPMMIKVTK